MNVMWSMKSEYKQSRDWPVDIVSVVMKFLKPLERIPYLTVNKSMINMLNSPLFASLRMTKKWTEFLKKTPHECNVYVETMDFNLHFFFHLSCVEIRSLVCIKTFLGPNWKLGFIKDSSGFKLRLSYNSKHLWALIWHVVNVPVKQILFHEGYNEKSGRFKQFLSTVLVQEYEPLKEAEIHPLFSMFLLILSKCHEHVKDTEIVLTTPNRYLTPKIASLEVWLKRLGLEEMSRTKVRRFSKEELFATV